MPLSAVLDAAGILASARFVVFYSYDDHRIVVADEFDDGGKRGNIQNGWATLRSSASVRSSSS